MLEAMNSRRRYLWLKVTRDRFELPLFVADTALELAAHFGVSVNAVKQSALRAQRGIRGGYFRKVSMEDDAP